MRANPFAILVSNADGIPFATHLPLLIDEVGDQIIVQGHMARANTHWKSMKEYEESLVIFHGPHAYISPSLYETRESVPTWNYAAVHAYGKGTIVTDEARLNHLLEELIAHFDSQYAKRWPSLPEQY